MENRLIDSFKHRLEWFYVSEENGELYAKYMAKYLNVIKNKSMPINQVKELCNNIKLVVASVLVPLKGMKLAMRETESSNAKYGVEIATVDVNENLLQYENKMPDVVQYSAIAMDTYKQFSEITVYSDGLYRNSFCSSPRISMADIVKQIPDEYLPKTAAVVLVIPDNFPEMSYDIVMNKYRINVKLLELK